MTYGGTRAENGHELDVAQIRRLVSNQRLSGGIAAVLARPYINMWLTLKAAI
jgi:hypothetical protein